MFIRSIGSLFVLMVVSGLVGGCKPSESPTAGPGKASDSPAAGTAQPAATGPKIVARLHWLGIRRIAAETNAGQFSEMLNLPESRRLAAQTLDKLALWLARVTITNAGGLVTNSQSYVAHSPTASLWRPLLDNLLQEETYLEVARAPGGPLDFVVAFRLEEPRAALWETNVAAALALTPEVRSLPAEEGVRGWQLSDSNRVALASLGGWTTLGLSSVSGSPLLADFRARIQRDRAPFRPSTNGAWVEGEADSGAVAEAMGLDFKPPSGCPKVSFVMTWDSGTVRTYGLLNFPKPLAGGTQPWEMPTNYIQGAISSFSAIRGIKPWLASLRAWNALEAGPPPDQLFAWGLQGLPMNTFFAAPQPDASNQVEPHRGLRHAKGESLVRDQ